MDVNILIQQLLLGTVEQPPTVLSKRAAQAIQNLSQRVAQDQELVLNLQRQINQLMETQSESRDPIEATAQTSTATG